MFENRMEAGEKIACQLGEKQVEADVVLVTSKKGIPVGERISKQLNVPIDMVLAGEISAPGEKDMMLGAVANDRTIWLKDDLIDELMVSDEYLSEAIEQELQNVRERLSRYRGNVKRPRLKDKKVVIVEDGLSSGLRMSACIGQVIKAAPEKITVAAPVISSYAFEKVEPLVDEVVALEQLRFLESVDSCYGVLGSQEELHLENRFVSQS